MRIASFILKITAVALAAASMTCAVAACLCASLQNDEE